jgi:hypothetical protein
MRPATGMRHVVPHPPASFDRLMGGRWLASALSWRGFPAVHHRLQHPRPTADPAVSSSPSNTSRLHAPPPQSRTIPSSVRPRKNKSDGPSGRSWSRYCTEIAYFKSPLYRAFPIDADPADRVVGPFSPLPCQVWHGYGISSAHHGEVMGCRWACERTPLRGRRRAPLATTRYRNKSCTGVSDLDMHVLIISRLAYNSYL